MAQRFDKFTERGRKVLELAQEEAQRFYHNYIGTEHLLIGLVREGTVAGVLADSGVDLNRVRSAVEFIIGRGERTITGDIGLTPRAKRVLDLSVQESRQLKQEIIGPEHLLLGLLREGEGVAVAILESLDVPAQELRDRVKKPLVGWQETVGTAEPEAQTVPFELFTGQPEQLEGLTDEISFRRLASGPGYGSGLVRFLPGSGGQPRGSSFPTTDLVCHVLEGRGRLTLGNDTVELEPGALCHVPAGTPHDFAALDEPLLLLYISIST